VHGWTLPGQRLFATGALVNEKAAMDGTDGYQTEIPDRPPDRALAETARTGARAAKIELGGADRLAVEGPLAEPCGSLHVSIAHPEPFLRFET
jgi:hypothetical protein